MELNFLGTAQAIPTESRNHTAMLLKYNDETILIDCGEGTQRQFRKAHSNPCKLTKLLITHWHGDHILGIPGLLQTLTLNGYNRTLDVYGPKGTKRYFNMIMSMFVYVGKINVNVHEIGEGKFYDNKFILEAFKMNHGTPCLAYSFKEKDKLRIDKNKLKKLKLKGEIIGQLAKGKNIKINGKTISAKSLTYLQEGKKISFVMDTKLCDNCYKAAKDSDVLVSESTYTEKEKDKAEEYGHLTAKQAATIAKKAKAKRLFLAHISQRYEKSSKLVLDEAKKVFKNTVIAEDLMKIEI